MAFHNLYNCAAGCSHAGLHIKNKQTGEMMVWAGAWDGVYTHEERMCGHMLRVGRQEERGRERGSERKATDRQRDRQSVRAEDM
jgi:hypothetical protein